MNLSEVLQNAATLIVVRAEDLRSFADVCIDHYLNLQEKNDSPAPKKPVSQSEAMERMNRSRQTLVKWRKKGILKGFLIGGRVYYEPSEIDELQKIKY